MRYHHAATLAIAAIERLVVYGLEGPQPSPSGASSSTSSKGLKWPRTMILWLGIKSPAFSPLQARDEQVFRKKSRSSNSKAEKLTQGISEDADRVGNGHRLSLFEWSNAVARAGRRGVSPVWAAVIARRSPAAGRAEGGGSGRGCEVINFEWGVVTLSRIL
ncbi:hypothetical protein NL676_021387 [Syzygium grande]|nr:hypothetical protein NL676_021387 [Syzygium grande]